MLFKLYINLTQNFKNKTLSTKTPTLNLILILISNNECII